MSSSSTRRVLSIFASCSDFDRREVFRACYDARYTMFSYRSWFDSCREARQAWPHLENHTLAALAAKFDIAYRAHAAVEDARVAGETFLRAGEAQARRPQIGK